MGQQQFFYRSDDEWDAFRQHLKLTSCPHCQVVGMLIGHGVLRGFDDTTPQRKTIRARRIFCSNRNARHGCGRTFSVWIAHKIRRLSLTTGCLWRFLQLAATGSLLAAIRAVDCPWSDRTMQRIWSRFRLAQSHIRTALCGQCSPPQGPPDSSARPEAQVLAHLRAAFPDADCPIADFQQSVRTFFV